MAKLENWQKEIVLRDRIALATLMSFVAGTLYGHDGNQESRLRAAYPDFCRELESAVSRKRDFLQTLLDRDW